MRVVSWAKENPGKAVFIVGAAGVAVWFLFFRGTGGAVQAYQASGPSDAQIAAGTQLQMAQLQVAAQAGMAQFELAKIQQTQAGNYALAELQVGAQSQMQVNELTYRQTVELANLSTQEAIATRTLDAQTAWATITSGAQIATQQIAAAQTIQLAQITSQTALGTAQIGADVQKTLAQYQRDVAISQAKYQADVTIAGYVAKGAGDAFSSILSFAGPIVGAFLSDRRLKRDIRYMETRNGYKLYSFRYVFGTRYYVGVIADEIEKIKPEAVSSILGFKAVDYAMLGLTMEPLENYAPYIA